MNKVFVLQHFGGKFALNLNKIADNIVVFDFQIGNVDRLGIFVLQFKNQFMAVFLQFLNGIERRIIAGADKAAVTRQQRQFFIKRLIQRFDQIFMKTQTPDNGGYRRGKFMFDRSAGAGVEIGQNVFNLRNNRQRGFDIGQIARTAAAETETGNGAFHIGAGFQQFADILPQTGMVHKELNDIQTLVDFRQIDQRTGHAPGKQAAADGGNRAVHHRKQSGAFVAGQRFEEFEVFTGCAVNLHHLVFINFDRFFNAGHLPFLGIFDIIQQNAGRRGFGAAEIAEGIQRFDLEDVLQAFAGIFAVKARLRQNRQFLAIFVENVKQRGILQI